MVLYTQISNLLENLQVLVPLDIITPTKKKLCHHQDVILTNSNYQKIEE